MLTAEKCALVNDIGDKLLELYDERNEAISDGDLDRLHELQMEIDDVMAGREKLLRGVEIH
jgi:hypothetical protein